MRAVDPVPRPVVLAGDLAIVAVFVLIGATMGHGEDPVANAGRIAMTTASFWIGWTLAALATRAYAADWAGSIPRAAGRTGLAWVVGVTIALALRSTDLFPGRAALSFFAVACLVGAAMLLPWRVALVTVASD